MDELLNDPARFDELILVDGFDRPIGTGTKERVHREGLLHRAFSVILVREGASGKELLVAQRSACKYHSAGLWANSCCSHPRAGEELLDAVHRRVREELGCEITDAREIAACAYRAVFDNGLCEYEYDHVLLARNTTELSPDPAEASDVCWMGLDELSADLVKRPERYAAWAPMVFTMALAELAQ